MSESEFDVALAKLESGMTELSKLFSSESDYEVTPEEVGKFVAVFMKLQNLLS